MKASGGWGLVPFFHCNNLGSFGNRVCNLFCKAFKEEENFDEIIAVRYALNQKLLKNGCIYAAIFLFFM